MKTSEYFDELVAANDCLVETVSSYMEFCDIVIKMPHCDFPALREIARVRKDSWLPILEHIKKAQKNARRIKNRE